MTDSIDNTVAPAASIITNAYQQAALSMPAAPPGILQLEPATPPDLTSFKTKVQSSSPYFTEVDMDVTARTAIVDANSANDDDDSYHDDDCHNQAKRAAAFASATTNEIKTLDPKQESIWSCFRVCFVANIVCVVLLAVALIVQARRHSSVLDHHESLRGDVSTRQNDGSTGKLHPKNLGSNNDHTFVVRINSGATEPYFDSNGNEWLADVMQDANAMEDSAYSVQGHGGLYTKSNISIANAGPEGVELYENERYFVTSGQYNIAVPPHTTLQVDLYFAEIFYTQPGLRVFDILIENQLVRKDYDIVQVAAAGLSNNGTMATRVSHNVTVTDDILSIQLVSLIEYAKISGLVVRGIVG